jgi:hypothetical protein
MPPEFVVITERATAVARRTWGAVLLAFQVDSAGIRPYAPDSDKNRELYFRTFEFVTRMLSHRRRGLKAGTQRTVEDCKSGKAQDSEKYHCEASNFESVGNYSGDDGY